MSKIEEFESIVGVKIDLYFKYAEKFKEYIKRAQKKKIEFKLSFDQFYLAVTAKCYICGISGRTTEIGIDRLDNKKGYTYYNIGPCCWNCNRMKADMSIPEFRDYLHRINPEHRFAKKLSIK
jgi:hypothetical protein